MLDLIPSQQGRDYNYGFRSIAVNATINAEYINCD